MSGAASQKLRVIDGEPTVPILAAKYLERFRCIGPRCEDSCCAGWSLISVDDESVRRYQSVANCAVAPKLQEKVIRPGLGCGADRSARIALNTDTTCPFHSAERLCSIQVELGEDYLPTTCQMFPRLTRPVCGVVERTAALSCPEIARLALLDPEGISFSVQEVAPWRDLWPGATLLDEAGMRTKSELYFRLREAALDIARSRQTPLAARLKRIGSLFAAADRAVALESHVMLEQLLDEYRWDEAEEGAKRITAGKGVSRRIAHREQIALLLAFFGEQAEIPASHQRYRTCREKVVAALGSGSAAGRLDCRRFRRAAKRHYAPFMRQNPHIMENYVVHTLVTILSSPEQHPTLLDAFASLVLRYSLVRSHLIGIAKGDGRLSEESTVMLVQSFYKSFEHGKGPWELRVQGLRRAGKCTLEHLEYLYAD